ncbi:hypothetical protein N9B05_05280 [Mariniblastus sp.]|nr:hypothetical protein [Mariniblastus sp.]
MKKHNRPRSMRKRHEKGPPPNHLAMEMTGRRGRERIWGLANAKRPLM